MPNIYWNVYINVDAATLHFIEIRFKSVTYRLLFMVSAGNFAESQQVSSAAKQNYEVAFN